MKMEKINGRAKETVYRRIFCCFLVVMLLMLTPIISAFAEESTDLGLAENEQILFTGDMAIEAAEILDDSLNPSDDLTEGEPVKFFNLDGQALGYIVDYYDENGEPHGYVIFDSTDESLVSMFSFAPGAMGPQTAAEKMIETDVALQNAVPEPSTVFKYNSFGFCVSDNDTSEAVTPTGDIIDLSDNLRSESKPISAWSDIFINYTPSGFTMSNFASLPSFLAWSENDVESETGTYACAVSAMLVPVHYYMWETDWSWNEDLATIYDELWDLSDTTVDHVSGGVTYGSTPNNEIGPAVSTFLADRGMSVGAISTSSPSYSFFTAAINRGDTAIFSCGINVSNGSGGFTRSGRAMAVEGYCKLTSNTTGASWDTLIVFDGWNDGGAYVNFNFANYTDTYGVSYVNADISW
jgi:hypothetical protein